MQKNIDTNWTNWDKTCDRFVVYLDLGGTKDMVHRKTHKEIYGKFIKIHNLIKSAQLRLDIEEKYDMIYTSQFSDSIYIFSRDDYRVSFELLVYVMRKVIYELIMQGIAIKGACAHGKITVDIEKSIFFGQPIVDAYELEEDTRYYGIVCHNSFEKQIDKYKLRYKNTDDVSQSFLEEDFFIAKTKLKPGDIEHANVNWFLHNKDTHEQIFTKVGKALKKIQMQVSGKPRIYIDNTMEMAKRALYP